jgi:hypothetical protein
MLIKCVEVLPERKLSARSLSDRDHFGPKALLRGLIPETRKTRRGDHPGDYFYASVLEGGDLRPKIVAERLETPGVDRL